MCFFFPYTRMRTGLARPFSRDLFSQKPNISFSLWWTGKHINQSCWWTDASAQLGFLTVLTDFVFLYDIQRMILTSWYNYRGRWSHSTVTLKLHQIRVRCVMVMIWFVWSVCPLATPTGCVLSLPWRSMVGQLESWSRGVPAIITCNRSYRYVL